MKLSVVVPVFNESRTIENVLSKIARVQLPSGLGREIVVVDDCSTDGTGEILERLQKLYPLMLIKHDRNYGKGRAIRTGLKACRGDFAIIQDADLEYDPNEYVKLIQPIIERKTDVVYGSRYLGKSIKGIISINFFANRVLTFVSNFFTGLNLTDMETCYKVLSRKAIDKVAPRLTSDRFDIEPEITAVIARSGFKVIEVPISYDPRTSRQGKKIKWHDGFPALWAIVKFSA